LTSPRASATRCFWPPDKFVRKARRLVFEVHQRQGFGDAAPYLRRASFPAISSGKAILPATVMCGNSA
jgi:hypothetical protein